MSSPRAASTFRMPMRGRAGRRSRNWLGVESSHLWRLRQVHGITVHTEAVAPCDGTWPEGDLLATDRHDVALAVRTADCVPILYADPRTGVVAAVHAGWRGTVAGAASRMVEVLAVTFGSRPEDLDRRHRPLCRARVVRGGAGGRRRVRRRVAARGRARDVVGPAGARRASTSSTCGPSRATNSPPRAWIRPTSTWRACAP